MTTNLMSLSAAKLKELKTGDKITIRHAANHEELEAGASRIIYEQFPLKAATAFSTTWATIFSPPTKNNKPTTTKTKIQPQRTSTTIVGGSVPMIQLVLTWVLSNCSGSGMQQFPRYNDKPYSKYYAIKETADLMSISILSKEMASRMNDIASRQIHSEDVRAMYLRLPRDHHALRQVVVHVANRFWNRQLKAAGAYRTLREEIPELDEDINELLGPLVEEHRKMKAQEAEARRVKLAQKKVDTTSATKGKARAAKGRQSSSITDRTSNDKNRIHTQQQHPSQTTSLSPGNKTTTTSQSKTSPPTQLQTKTIRCRVARKAQRGRPAYVSLPLADAGIRKEDFIGNPVRVRSQGQLNRDQVETSINEEKEEKKNKTGDSHSNIANTSLGHDGHSSDRGRGVVDNSAGSGSGLGTSVSLLKTNVNVHVGASTRSTSSRTATAMSDTILMSRSVSTRSSISSHDDDICVGTDSRKHSIVVKFPGMDNVQV